MGQYETGYQIVGRKQTVMRRMLENVLLDET